MKAFWQSFLILFLAEMGDKTQIVSFAFGAKYPLVTVLLGIFIAISALMAAAAGVGNILGHYIPAFWMSIISGLLFIGFGIWTLCEKESEENDVPKPKQTRLGPLMAVIVTFSIAEMGDKTIFASLALAGKYHDYFMVWLGSTLGMFAADALAMICGRVLGKQLPEKALRWGSAIVLIGAGIYTIVDTVGRQAHP
jgi:putative Ca2+/H+ antiporter (TMEM165/GDT1 family)